MDNSASPMRGRSLSGGPGRSLPGNARCGKSCRRSDTRTTYPGHHRALGGGTFSGFPREHPLLAQVEGTSNIRRSLLLGAIIGALPLSVKCWNRYPLTPRLAPHAGVRRLQRWLGAIRRRHGRLLTHGQGVCHNESQGSRSCEKTTTRWAKVAAKKLTFRSPCPDLNAAVLRMAVWPPRAERPPSGRKSGLEARPTGRYAASAPATIVLSGQCDRQKPKATGLRH